ncbi:YbhB/YbcL family Raf kinase inhibitor-like protein [Corynebacterium lowii]|uniref:Putative kinase inhibitor protein n=1 Tax=Corynebacterium lowii TaxID=1544413 RepID=A0A0Q0Z847_9CORY|nr:YbhB/YbcL family Raf kinase inhibitor-like protein [Corynebacterium lowii]KQB85765.1 putative kinase inhibitor protein [Corynebacterium lowii]MDP9851067.1 Raf kinase inhibitor-like YbhB/YbcL family protein [Corynebacterium lowii]
MSYSYAHDSRFPGPDPYAPLKKLPEFSLRSEDFEESQRLSENIAAPSSRSPHLAWSDLPEGTKSLAITCFDPDAPTAAGFWHWAVCNIPVNVTEITAGEEIEGALSLVNDSGQRSFYGPQPPEGHGPHRYLFAVHAVDVEELEIDATASPTVLGFQLYFHSLGRAILWGWYEN